MINQRLNEAVARKFGYNGPADPQAVDKFLMSKPESIATVRRALNIMKPTTAMAEGGDTETTATTTPVEPDDVPTKTPEEMAEEVVQGQRQMVRDAFVDPQALVAKPEVAKIDPTAAGRTIDPTAGQITAPLPQAGQPDFFTQIQQPLSPRMPSTSQRIDPKIAAFLEIYGFEGSANKDIDNLPPDEKAKLEEVTARTMHLVAVIHLVSLYQHLLAS